MAYHNRIHAASPKAKNAKKKKSLSFTPEAPIVQAKTEKLQSQMPVFNPDTSVFKTDPDNPYASLFGTSAFSSPPVVQAKLTVGAVGDRYEQEADTVAANVVKTINQPQDKVQPQEEDSNALQAQVGEVQRQGMAEDDEVQRKPPLQRKGMAEEDDLQTKPTLQRVGKDGGSIHSGLESQIQTAKGHGQALEPGLQQRMGQAMGADFSGVKVHTDSQSNQLNESIQSKAFTTGSDVFFRSGAYDLGSKGGQELIAHELTHVVQQGGTNESVQRQGDQVIQRVIYESWQDKTKVASPEMAVKYLTAKNIKVQEAKKLVKKYESTGEVDLPGLYKLALQKGLLQESSEQQNEDKTKDFQTEHLSHFQEDQRAIGKNVKGPDGSVYARIVPLHAESYQVQKGTVLDNDGKIFKDGFEDKKGQPTQRLGFNPANYENVSSGALDRYEQEVLVDSRQLKSLSLGVMEAPAEKGYKFSDQESKFLHSFHIAKGGKFATLTPKPGVPQQAFIAARSKLNVDGGKGTDVGEHCPYHTGTHYPGTPPGGAHQHTYNPGKISLKAVDTMLDICVEQNLLMHDGDQADKEAVANRVRKKIGTPGAAKADQVDKQNKFDPLVSRMKALGRMENPVQHSGPGPGRLALYEWLETYVDGQNNAPETMNCWQSVLWAARSAGLIDSEYLKQANEEVEVEIEKNQPKVKVNRLSQVIANSSNEQSQLTHPNEVQGSTKDTERRDWYRTNLPNCNIPRGQVVVFGSGGSHVCLSTGGGNAIELDNRGMQKVVDPKVEKARKKYERLLALEKEIENTVKSKKEEIKKINTSDMEEGLAKQAKTEIRKAIRLAQKQMSFADKKQLTQLKKDHERGHLDSSKNQKGERLKNEVKERDLVEIGEKYFGLIDGIFWGELPSKSSIMESE